jgi:1-acyl-sn-glycerol-3-phosphate acyltransferase
LPLRTAIAACRTIAAYVFCSLYTLIVGSIALILSLVFRWPSALFAAANLAVRLALAIVGLRYEVHGAEHIDPHRPSVYCVNHSSNVEPPILYLVLKRLGWRRQILYKAELHSLPVLGRGFDFVGFVPIQRGNREQSNRAIERASERIRAGYSFLVFPEGTRSRTGELLPFKKGASILAIRAQAPLVPMAIVGARAAMRKGSFIIWPVTIRIRIGEPIPTGGITLEARNEVTQTLRARILELLLELAGRAEHAPQAAEPSTLKPEA